MKISTLLFLPLFIVFSSCDFMGPSIQGEGELVQKKINLDGFSGIALGTNATIELRKGPHSVEVSAQQNILDNLEIEVDRGRLKINNNQRVSRSKEVTIRVSLPELDELVIGGSGNILGEDLFDDIDNLELNIGGSGNISLDFEADRVDISIAGSGDMTLSGTAESVDISVSGSGDVDANQLNTDRCDVSIAGSGDVRIGVEEKLEVSIAGSGDVYYRGRPKVKSSIAGSGGVHKM
ncbi:MAG: DUF2807 domain-containing protein [Bacteroidetes bacterium]|nr:DUF2807 domain-containing protein [Bacteroidota bacterium]